MYNQINLDHLIYQNILPYPHMFMDNFLNVDFAKSIQTEILAISEEEFDRYENPFEQKYTLRDKYNYPPNLSELMKNLTSDSFVSELSKLTGYQLINDHNRNFWGVHKYKTGDKLDIHVDAGKHPNFDLKKQVTLGIYLSSNWDPSYGCELEIWEGDNASRNDAKIHKIVNKIAPIFNRLIIFTCNDYSWHGNPETVKTSDENSFRIFVTLSYLSNNQTDENKRVKAFFVSRPNDPFDPEKDKLRILRADPEKYKDIYKYNLINVSIVCLIYKSTKYLQFVYDQVKKYTNLSNCEFYFVTNDATEEVIHYLSDNKIPHYIFNNTPENIKEHGVNECYINNVYRAYNYGVKMAKGKYVLMINSDMAFSPNWFENLYKHISDDVCVNSRLVESGRYPSGKYGITYDCGQFLYKYDEQKFLKYAEIIKEEGLHSGGLFMPLLIKKAHFDKIGGYPEGNIVPNSDIFMPIIAKKGADCIPGDKIFVKKLETIGVYHKTSFDSIVYHFQSGEMYE